MTKSNNEETAAEPASRPEDSEVGYRRPPRATRFQPGISGNPRGRPKGSRNRAPSKSALQRFRAVVFEEAYREITIEEDGKTIKIPAMQAAVRSLADQAAEGDRRAQEMLFQLVAEVGREERAEKRAAFDAAVAYKEKALETLAQRKETGQSEPAILPHPDDVLTNVFTQTVVIRGPETADEKLEWDALWADRAEVECRMDTAEAGLALDPNDAALRAELEGARKAIEDIDAELALFERVVTGGSED